MAKKIRLDFTKTEERSGINTRRIPEGLHRMKVDSFSEKEAADGTAMLVFMLVPEDARYRSRRFPFYCKLQQNQMWKLRDLLVAAGQVVPKKAISIDPSVIVGKSIAAEVEDELYQGNERSTVNGTYGLDILDEDGSSAPADPEDDEGEDPEEFDETETEDETEDEEEDELEEEVEDLNALSLSDLRARAKELGIDTAGVKKAALIDLIIDAEAEEDDSEEEDDEDDLDDDELDDEDLEDEDDEDLEEEEEEPEPAPRRRSAKTAAKPAAAPAAKRTVRRR